MQVSHSAPSAIRNVCAQASWFAFHENGMARQTARNEFRSGVGTRTSKETSPGKRRCKLARSLRQCPLDGCGSPAYLGPSTNAIRRSTIARESSSKTLHKRSLRPNAPMRHDSPVLVVEHFQDHGATGAGGVAGAGSAFCSGGFFPNVIASITSCVPLLYRLRLVVVMS